MKRINQKVRIRFQSIETSGAGEIIEVGTWPEGFRPETVGQHGSNNYSKTIPLSNYGVGETPTWLSVGAPTYNKNPRIHVKGATALREVTGRWNYPLETHGRQLFRDPE